MNAALYIRVSSAEQIKGYSLEAQEDLLRRYAKDHNMTVYKLYADEGKSANKALHKRTALLEMVKDAEAKRFSIILFKDITRWSRRSADYFVIQDRLDKCGCAWIAVEQEHLETRSPSGRFTVSVMLGTAQLESENNSQRVRFVYDAMVRNGIYPLGTHHAPIGYTVDSNRHLIKDPKTEPMITDMFRYLLEHRNQSATRRYIQDKYGKSYTSSDFSKLVHNTIYFGRYRDMDDFCEPYITEAEYDAITDTKSPFSVRTHTDSYIFRQLCKCAECGATMSGTIIRGHTYYRCPNNYMAKGCGMNHSLRQDRLEQMMLKEIRPAFDAYKYRVEIEQSKADNSERIKSLRAKLKRLTEMYIDGAIDRDSYDARKASVSAELADLRCDRTTDIKEVETALNEPWETLYTDLDEQGRSAFWRSMVDHIVWNGSDISIAFK